MAVAIAIGGDHFSPSFVKRAELMLSDPRKPSTMRPYHSLARMAREAAEPLVARDVAMVHQAASKSVRAFIERLREAKVLLRSAAIVSDRDPPKIGNPHLQAHADERRLFCEATAAAWDECGIGSIFLLEEQVTDKAATKIGVSATRLEQWLTEIGAAAGRPWRTDEKTAAIAAWIALTR
jgi:hypothetical protein